MAKGWKARAAGHLADLAHETGYREALTREGVPG